MIHSHLCNGLYGDVSLPRMYAGLLLEAAFIKKHGSFDCRNDACILGTIHFARCYTYGIIDDCGNPDRLLLHVMQSPFPIRVII